MTAALTSVVPFVRAAGTPYELGHAHGSALAAPLRAFLDDGVCRLGHLRPEPVTWAGLRPRIEAYGAALAVSTPRLHAEVQGLAAGAGIALHEALLLQIRRELMGYLRVPTAGDCTTYARAQDPVLAQTVDLNGNLDDVIAVLALTDPASGRESLVLSFGGLLGYLGLNSDGLAIGINLVLGGVWGPCVPPYLVIRHLLDSAGSVAEALDVLRGLRVTSSRALTLCDATAVACVEIIDGELHVVTGPESVHANHFLTPDLGPRDELNVFARNSSVGRLDHGRAGLAQLPPGAPAADHFDVLARPPLCVPDRGDIRAERTVAAVVMFPERGELHLRPGDPSLSAARVFTLGAVG
ncbi:MAG: C45 family peptidase [Frankiaceae bacterium]|nr:C45 family peptidase [Frankiaceae bacterium]